MKFIVLTCKGREGFVNKIKEQIPDIIVNFDDFNKEDTDFLSTAWLNYQRSFLIANDEPAVYMDDDVILTSNFIPKIEAAISKYPNNIIQFFSMKKDDITKGTRVLNGKTFSMNQCFYLPAKLSLGLYNYMNTWKPNDKHKHAPVDICMAEYFGKLKLNYINWCPSLVQHLEEPSQIKKGRSTKRQSLSFIP